jgi:FKBP-type peptidyl-prolyl cis-trans isomerase (trigger factor)
VTDQPLLRTTGFEVVRAVEPVTALMVADRLDTIRDHYATWEIVTESPAKGDRVAIEYQTAPEGEAVGPLVAEYFTISGGRTTAGFEAMLGTMLSGQRVEGRLALGEDFHDPASRGTVRQVVVVLHKVERKVLPAIDQAFAQKLKYPDVAAMMKGVHRDLELSQWKKASEAARLELLTQFSEANASVRPVSQEEIDASLKEAVNFGHVFDTPEKLTEGELRARTFIRLPVLLDLLATQWNLAATRTDVRQAAREAKKRDQSALKFSEILAHWEKDPKQIAAVRRAIAHRKVVQALEKENPYTDRLVQPEVVPSRPQALVIP